MTPEQRAIEERRLAAERGLVVMVQKLVKAARDGRAHLNHEGARDCEHCQATRAGVQFVRLMQENLPSEAPAIVAADTADVIALSK